MNRCISLLILVVLSAVHTNCHNVNSQKLRLIYSWKSLDFAYPNDAIRQQAITNGLYKPGAPVPIDVDISRVGNVGPKVFVTIPRFQEGVPATLGYVSNRTNAQGDPIIIPYPSWEMNTIGDCDHITSVYRIKVDECGRLWVLDTGKLIDTRICPPQLLVFNLENNRLISRYRFPNDQLLSDSLLITPAVDIRDPTGRCHDTFVYIADVSRFQLIVYDHRNRKSWNIQNNLFYPYPPHGHFTINGESFDLMDGLFGLALSPLNSNGDRTLYFHSLASVTECSVSTSIIRNSTLFVGQPDAQRDAFQPYKQVRPSQSAAQAMDRNGVLFYGLMSETAIGCWNSKNFQEFGGNNLDILVSNQETLQFASGLKISTPARGSEELWVITVSFQKVMTGTLDQRQTNFRIQAGFVDELIRGTKCAAISRDGYHGSTHNRQVPSSLDGQHNHHWGYNNHRHINHNHGIRY